MARALPLLLALLVACNGEPEPVDRSTSPDASPTAASPAGPSAEELLFLRRTTLVSYNLDTNAEEVLGEFPSADAALSPDGTRIAVVEERSPLGPAPEGFRDPFLLLETIGDDAIELGPGRSPLWSPDGASVAAIVPTDEEECPGVETEGAGCPATEQVVIYDPAAPGEPEVVAEPALGYSLLGWSGDDVVSLRAPGVTVLNGQKLPMPPAEVWGVSPAEDLLLQVDDAGARFMRIDAQAPRAEIDLDGARLADGTWSFDGLTVGVVLIEPAGARVATRLALIDSVSGEVTIVPDSERAQGQVVWTSDSSQFAYVRVHPENARKLQTVTCTLDLDCDALFSFREGVTLLGLS